MTEIDYYEIVRQKLAVGPLVAPKHQKIHDLLRVFWDEEVIKILAVFPSIGKPISLRELAEKTGLDRKKIKSILQKAVAKKTLVKHGTKYELAPLVPGIFEAYFIARQDTKENLEKAAEAYRFIFKNVNELQPPAIRKDFEMFRPLLPIESKDRLIAINESIEARNEVLPYELVEDLINNSEYFAVIPCQCRYIGEVTGEPCEIAPSEMGCFITGIGAQALARFGLARALTKEEAINYLKKTEKAGLVHCTSNSKGGEHLQFICNCCPCHCGILKPTKKHGFKIISPSNFRPKIDSDTCVECELCMKKCPMSIITHDAEGKKMLIDLSSCIGCGVCATNCAKNAIKMEKIEDKIPPDVIPIGEKTFMEHLGSLLS
ncbi:MAG: 4Fe-4S dicluster domain-containing protein [Candidatus Helarchaeota archaeon]